MDKKAQLMKQLIDLYEQRQFVDKKSGQVVVDEYINKLEQELQTELSNSVKEDCSQNKEDWFRNTYADTIPKDGTKDEIIKTIRKYLKKKRRVWTITLGYTIEIDNAYFQSSNYLDFILESFTKEEQEKYNLSKLKVGVTPINDIYVIQTQYN